MGLEPVAGFEHFETHHCVTGSMRHIYLFHGHDVSEEMLLGIGNGVSYSYWHFKGQPPFMGGRGGFKPPLEELTGQRTGVRVELHQTTSARKARQSLLTMLEAGQPVMIQCDMGFLPYFDFGGEAYHFGGHVVVVCGYDAGSDQVLVADRDKALHAVSMEELARARGSTFKPFPPKNGWWTFDFSEKRKPTAEEVRQAIREQAQAMLEPPIRNIGVAGIRKAAKMVPTWPVKLDREMLRFTLFNAHIFISAVGGTGGGAFRYMFSRFLREAAEITGEARLEASADEFRQIGDEWEKLAEWFREAAEAADAEEFPDGAMLAGCGEEWAALRGWFLEAPEAEPAEVLRGCVVPLNRLADLEEAAWGRLVLVNGG